MRPNWSLIVIHHSASKDHPEAPSWEVLRQYHLGKGWQDIGYHFGLERVKGEYAVQIGRSLTVEGAHCMGANTYSLGICCVGNFEETVPPDELYQVLGRCIVRPLMDMFGIPEHRVRLHREMTATLCPGKYFSKKRLMEVVSRP